MRKSIEKILADLESDNKDNFVIVTRAMCDLRGLAEVVGGYADVREALIVAIKHNPNLCMDD